MLVGRAELAVRADKETGRKALQSRKLGQNRQI
jgi:hypothetical protein